MALPSEYVSLEGVCASIKARNPRLLCALAEKLEAVLDPLSVFTPGTLYVHGAASDSSGVTYRDLASYFRSAAERHIPVLFQTPYQAFEAQTVRIFRDWISSQVRDLEAEAVQASFAESSMSARGSAQILKLGNGAFTAAYENQPHQMDASTHDHILRRIALNNDQRRAQEAASRDALSLVELKEELAATKALLAHSEQREKLREDENRQLRDDRLENQRTIQNLELESESLMDQLERFKVLFDPHHPLHPPKLVQAIECYLTVTENGTRDPSGPGGRGAQVLAESWLKDQGEIEVKFKIKCFGYVIGWRGKGSGAIRSK
ncbi:hypothetical protein YA0002_11510 [Pseudomonas cichorii]|uniref:hypothetical protein n=1 Tax=Pseudomonas cichorii TaxID=36746 RepID=UPI0018E66198|nr:hypothetical protein [Pseudomonas cichorii]MBI6853394.1 hypothetical protein [Pseudomonas cichorii]